MGFLKRNLPALALKRMISTDGIKTVRVVLSASDQPTREIQQIEAMPARYKAMYAIKTLYKNFSTAAAEIQLNSKKKINK